MNPQHLIGCNKHWWKELAKRCKHAVLFLDEKIAETLHWNLALSDLLESGIFGIQDLTPENVRYFRRSLLEGLQNCWRLFQYFFRQTPEPKPCLQDVGCYRRYLGR